MLMSGGLVIGLLTFLQRFLHILWVITTAEEAEEAEEAVCVSVY